MTLNALISINLDELMGSDIVPLIESLQNYQIALACRQDATNGNLVDPSHFPQSNGVCDKVVVRQSSCLTPNLLCVSSDAPVVLIRDGSVSCPFQCFQSPTISVTTASLLSTSPILSLTDHYFANAFQIEAQISFDLILCPVAEDILMQFIPGVLNPSDGMTKLLRWVLHHRHARRRTTGH